ncbi:histidine kinase-like ATPase domain protein [Mycobacterium ulcerans str. Harvey]|uniref:Histidine kinase-like ATPase domain protein n=1 Tax=Mycobacterium ulcerans str. Harvey TaxID=1299332 RepID=A0ABP3A8V6_MYCUL|nr:histidine kinase-like ATPase domain protein [Mycobacterium ulcerans str. Harvey]
MVVTAEAKARYLEPSGAGPLGSDTGFPVRTELIGVGDVVLLYTDGLIERPGRPLGASTAEFADLAANITSGGGFVIDAQSRPIDRLCSETLELLLRSTGYNDDITLLAVQRRAPTPPLNITEDATIHAARAIRSRLRQWLSEIGADSGDISDIVHAISEFVENAVEHGYSTDVSDGLAVAAALGGDGKLRVAVIDHGTWKHHREGERGRAEDWPWPKPWSRRRMSATTVQGRPRPSCTDSHDRPSSSPTRSSAEHQTDQPSIASSPPRSPSPATSSCAATSIATPPPPSTGRSRSKAAPV